MHFTRRVFLYISRKKGKTISLFLIIFIVAVFLVPCFSVLHASERLGEDIRTSIGAAFYIRANTEVSMNENGETEVKKNKVHITQKMVDEIMRTGEIKYYNPMNYGFAKSDAIHFIPGERHTEESDMGKVTALRLSSLGDLMKILLVLVSVVSAAVLTLLLMMRMRGRMREAGILLSVGISKREIVAGLLLEVLSVAVLAWALSHIISLVVTSFLGRNLFGGLRPNLLNDEILRAGTDGGIQMERYLKLEGIETLFIYVCQCVVVAVSTFVSSIAVVRLKPKDILSKMS